MTEPELDQIMTFHWPLVVRRVMSDNTDKWLQGFVRSISRHGKRPTWKPTQKQEQIMRRLLTEIGREAEPEFDLIER